MMKFKTGEKICARYVVPGEINNGKIIYVLGPHNGEIGTIQGCLGNIYRVTFANRQDAFLRADDLERMEPLRVQVT